MPPFVGSDVLISHEGELWIGRNHAATDTSWHYDLFGLNGKLIGVATLRADARIAGFGAGTVYVARTDPADDLVYLERRQR